MAKFADRLGRTFELAMTVADLKPLGELGITFAGFEVTWETLPLALFTDPAKLMEVLMLLAHLGPDVTPEDFGRGLDSAALERAIGAALETLADFSPTSPQGAAKSRLLREAWAKGLGVVSSECSKIGAGNSPDSSASTPTAAP